MDSSTSISQYGLSVGGGTGELWHAGGDFAFTLPLGGLVQPMPTSGLPENPETKRRLKNLMDVTGLLNELDARSHSGASFEDLLRVHPRKFLENFKALSDKKTNDHIK